ncbi:hypothetical protein MVLG_06212 [Microbotryum lychnidis-dioicae p1A1 Lamole]|uniref:Uncharacterized protein n=1 Tax=Microbotryum lychnidis-dioicae (strain p1A1 Lamole / MvSl-1064) TaxID=683840 RepID=U5HGK7_USTV1|nr:hypothetical protein MVLG_06212 [Microbotryum lychnidis-dioicae p1A1 Lamole]|eukprot:KDE03282.1 hypothetical protein MVLG_06212 [Microbotryum lychnidis-dioicae p1A1 Lamole]
MAALFRIFLNVDYDSSGFSPVFRCEFTPVSGFNETALRVESLGPSTQQALQGRDEKAPEFVKVSSLDCIPPSVLAHSGSGAYAAFKLDTPPVLLPQLGGSDKILTTTNDSSTATPSSRPVYQLWAVRRLLEHAEETNKAIREVAVSIYMVANLPSTTLRHIALAVDCHSIPASKRRLPGLPNGGKRRDVGILTIAVPELDHPHKYRSILDKKNPPTIAELANLLALALDDILRC